MAPPKKRPACKSMMDNSGEPMAKRARGRPPKAPPLNMFARVQKHIDDERNFLRKKLQEEYDEEDRKERERNQLARTDASVEPCTEEEEDDDDIIEIVRVDVAQDDGKPSAQPNTRKNASFVVARDNAGRFKSSTKASGAPGSKVPGIIAGQATVHPREPPIGRHDPISGDAILPWFSVQDRENRTRVAIRIRHGGLFFLDGPGDKCKVAHGTRGADITLNFLLAYDYPVVAIAKRPPNSGFIVDGYMEEVLWMETPPPGALTIYPPRAKVGKSSALDWLDWCPPSNQQRDLFCWDKFSTNEDSRWKIKNATVVEVSK